MVLNLDVLEPHLCQYVSLSDLFCFFVFFLNSIVLSLSLSDFAEKSLSLCSMNFGDFAKTLCLSRSVEPGITENPFVFKPSEELSGSHVRRRCVSPSNNEFAGPSGFSDEKKSHHVPLPSLSNDQVNRSVYGSVCGSGSVSSVSSSGSG
ncbi:hypothetical protein YC2023_073865 [Brassica napus]